MKSSRPRTATGTAVGLTLLSSLMFGTSGTAQALGPDTLPVGTSAARLSVGTLLLVASLPSLGHHPREVLAYLRRSGVWLAGACVCIFQFGYFYAAQHAGVALGALVTMGSIPLLTGIAGTLLGHRITTSWLLSTIACAVGLILLGYQGVSGGDTLGVIAAVVAAIAGAAFTLTVKRVIDNGAHPDLAQAALYVVAGGVMLSTALATSQFAWITSPSGIALALWLGIVTMALPNALWVRGLGVLSPGVTATLLIGEPLTATVLGVVLLDEHLTAVSWCGLAIVAAGLVALGFTASKDDVPVLHE